MSGSQRLLDLELRNEVSGDMRTGPVAHQLLAGLECVAAAWPVVGLAPRTALYANASGSLIPNAGSRGVGGVPLPPTRSSQQEVGAKGQRADGRLTATLAVFRIDKTDGPVPTLANPQISIPSGRQRSRGMEAELTGQIAPGWNAAASYAWTTARQISDGTLLAGSGLAGVPRHAVGAYTSFTFAPESRFAGWGGGIGLRAQTTREATLPSTFRLPGFVTVDASVWDRFTLRGNAARAQVDVSNLTDAAVYDTDGGAFLQRGPPRAVYAALAVDF